MIARFYEWLWGFSPESVYDCMTLLVILLILVAGFSFLGIFFYLEILPDLRKRK